MKKLLDGGYVELVEGGYIATRKALKTVVYGASTNQAPSMPDITTLIYIENREGETLLLNRNRNPFLGWYGVPGGLVHLGESLPEAAMRELTEKTSLVASGTFRAAGVLDYRYVQRETRDMFLHTIGFIYEYKYTGDREELNEKVTRYGKLSWSKLSECCNILPEVYVIQDLVKSSSNTVALSVDFEEPASLPILSTESLVS